MAKQSLVKNRRKLLNPIFHVQTKNDNDTKLTTGMINNIRRTGQCNLSGRSLTAVPERMFTMYELSKDDLNDRLDFDKHSDNDEESWWQFKPLSYLDLSSNVLQGLPSGIEMFEDLSTINLQDNNIIALPPEIGKLTKLAKLNLAHNKLAMLPDEFYKLVELEVLNLGHNCLEEISKHLGDLVMLRNMDLSNNCLKKLPSGIGYLVRLSEINVSHNKLTELPPDLVNIRGLVKLDLTHNDLKCLPKMGELRKLEFLYAQHNDIRMLPDFEGCERIQQLYFGNNFLQEIPVEFCENMPHLKILDLRDNQIQSIPRAIVMIQNLIRLDLSNNELTTLPNEMGLLPHMQNILLDGNKLKQIRNDIIKAGTIRLLKYLREKLAAEDLERMAIPVESISPEKKTFPDRYAMRNARGLHLTMKELTNVPDEVFEDAKTAGVDVVDLCKNKLHSVPSGLKLIADNLTELNLSMNQIKEIPEFISECVKLKYLAISKNLLSSLPQSLSSLVYLRELVISNNRFTNIPECVYDMCSLEILLASDNKIQNIDVVGLQKLKLIATLDLSNNNISQVPNELGNVSQLRTLEIKGNAFRQPRYAILEQGTQSVLAYLRDRIPR